MSVMMKYNFFRRFSFCKHSLFPVNFWIRVFPAVIPLTLFSCAHVISQFYPDTYYPQIKVYENKPLQFDLTFSGNWHISTDPNTMDKGSGSFARSLYNEGIDLLFVGSTFEGFHGTRGIAVNLNEPARDYAEYIRKINNKDIQNDKGLSDFEETDVEITRWIYDKYGFRFVEYFFNSDTYDIRISFWAKPDYFEKFLPVYEKIMSSLTITNGF